MRETGVKAGKYWLPAEADTTILYPKKWYYNKNSKPRTLKQFTDLYYTTIGRNASFNLGLSIGPSGRITDADAKAMIAQKKQLDKEFAVNLVKNASVSASNARGGSKKYSAINSIDGSTKTYWATDDGVSKATMEILFGEEKVFNRIVLQENIALGQRVDEFTVEAFIRGRWQEVVSGTTIGYKRALRFTTVKASKVRISLRTDADCLTLSNVGIYNAPIIMTEPVIRANRNGGITIEGPAGSVIYYAIGNKVIESGFKEYSVPFDLSGGGTVSAYVLDPADGSKSDVITKQFSMAKIKWKILGCSYPNEGNAAVDRLIDGDNKTMWHTHGKEGRSKPPHWVTVDLGETVTVKDFTYMPRHDGCFVGLVDRYELYLSMDGKNWSEPVAKGEFANIRNNPIEQVIKLDKPVRARYMKFVGIHALEDNDCVAVCEIGINGITQ